MVTVNNNINNNNNNANNNNNHNNNANDNSNNNNDNTFICRCLSRHALQNKVVKGQLSVSMGITDLEGLE